MSDTFEYTGPPPTAEDVAEGRRVNRFVSVVRRSGMTRTTPMRRRVRTMPPKVRRAVAERSGEICERCGVWCPTTGQVHHKVKRSQGGTNDPALLCWLCPDCHSWVEAHPAQAVREGWTIQHGKVA